MGPATILQGQDGTVCDVIYQKAYLLQGDLGAFRKQGRNTQKTGEGLGVERVKGVSCNWTLDMGQGDVRV